jgi:hypothetical protein
MTDAAATPPAESGVRVSTLELFFDLVFVFTITQLDRDPRRAPHPRHPGKVLLMLFVVWWMYSGYAWLTNAVAPNSSTRRTLLLTGMAGFLVMALAIPEAFGEYGWLFGVSYLVVNLVHSGAVPAGRPGRGRRCGSRPAEHPGGPAGAGRRVAARAVPAPVLDRRAAGADLGRLPAQPRDALARRRALRRAARPGRDRRDRRVDHRDRRSASAASISAPARSWSPSWACASPTTCGGSTSPATTSGPSTCWPARPIRGGAPGSR